MAGDKAAVLAEYQAAYQAFRDAIAGLTEGQLEKVAFGEWGIREIAGHLLGWHEQLGGGIQRMAQGLRPTPEGVNWNDVDAWNRDFAGGIGTQTAAEVLAALDAETKKFVAALEAIPAERFGEGKTVNAMASGAGFHHFREHAEEIQQVREAGGLD